MGKWDTFLSNLPFQQRQDFVQFINKSNNTVITGNFKKGKYKND